MRKKQSDVAVEPPTSIESLLEEFAERTALPSTSRGTWVAEVVDDRHPDLVGRIRVRWVDGSESRTVERWVPTLAGLPVRRGDRVTVQQPDNWPEPIVCGVLDGYARREVDKHDAGHIELRRDEAIELRDHRGRPLLAIQEGDTGPIVRILSENLGIDVPGHLRLTGATLELRATEGNADIEASDDVVVRAETIHLN